MEFKTDINGIEVQANYSEENIKNIFIPLLKNLDRLQKEKNRRILVMMVAPPGAGKSTLCEFLKYLSLKEDGLTPIQVIGMDGFHRYQDYLISHTTIRDGKEVLMVNIKGAPETFDLNLLEKRIEMIKTETEIGWPVYNRMTHNPTENAITITENIVLLEGNYLLLSLEGWNNLKNYADYTIRISAKEEDLRSRLVDRKIKSGASKEKAVQFVENSDLYNARTCLKHSVKADLNLKLNSDNTYSLLKDYSNEPDIPDCGCIYG